MKPNLLACLLMGTALTHVSQVAAQDIPTDDDSVFLGTLRIGGADAQALLGNEEISEEDIGNRNPSTTKDVFVGESAITASGGAAIAQKVFVNGIEESLLSVTIDGARQNKSPWHHSGNVLLDPELLKSVEVSRGLAPADAGPNALAGSIAYETKDASDLLDDGDNFGGIGKLSFGTNVDEASASLALFGRAQDFEYLLSYTRRTSDDYEDGSNSVNDGTGAELEDIVIKLAYDTGDGPRLEFSASRTEDTGLRAGQPGGPSGTIFIRPDFDGVVGRSTTLVEALSRRTSYTVTYTNDQASGIWDPTIQLSYNEQLTDAVGTIGQNSSFSGTAKNAFQIANGTVTAGFDFFNDTAERIDVTTGAVTGTEEIRSYGAFVQVRQDVGERLSFSYGARYDYQKFTGNDASEFSDHGLSLNGSMDLILNDRWTLNAGLASSWGGYELGEAGLISSTWTYDGMTPSRANAARLGVRYANGPWNGSFALFRTDIKDINAVLPARGTDARGTTSDLTSQGADASLRYSWDSGFASLNWTYADVELNDETIGTTAFYLGRPVGHIIALETGWDINEQWRVGGNAQIALDNDDAGIDGYQVVNAYATYTPPAIDNLEIRFDLRNVFDRTYSSRSSDGISSTRVTPLTEPGRTLQVTARFTF